MNTSSEVVVFGCLRATSHSEYLTFAARGVHSIVHTLPVLPLTSEEAFTLTLSGLLFGLSGCLE